MRFVDYRPYSHIKMKPDASWIPIVGILLLFSQKCTGLSCYQCDSNDDADCTEYFDHEHYDTLTVRSTDCTVDAAKYCIKTTGVWGGIVGTTRFCSSRDMGNQCQFVRYPDHDRVYRACIYTCQKDHCNGASMATYSAVTATLLTTVSFMYNILL